MASVGDEIREARHQARAATDMANRLLNGTATGVYRTNEVGAAQAAATLAVAFRLEQVALLLHAKG